MTTELSRVEDVEVDRILNKTIIIDIDGTIVGDGSHHPSRAVITCINQLKQNNTVYFSTNSRDMERNEKIAFYLPSPIIRSRYRKPSTRSLESIEVKGDLIVIGDKYITDGLLAKRMGGEFIKIRHLLSGRERLIVLISYWLDDLAYAFSRLLDS